jgi:hypothetical protein
VSSLPHLRTITQRAAVGLRSSPQPSPRGRGRRRLTAIAVPLLAIAAALWLVVGVAVPASTKLTNGFAAYYTAAHLIRERASADRFYDDDWFQAETIRLGFGRARDIYNLNPPAAALILWPLADLNPVSAKQVWTWVNLVFLGLACLALAASEPGDQWLQRAALALALVGLFEPVIEGMRLGQVYALLLLLEAGFVLSVRRKFDSAAGVSLAVMLAFKTAGLALPAMLAVRRRWVALTSTLVGSAIVVAAASAVLGPSAWATYARAVISVESHREIAMTAYQSVPGFLAHLFRFDPEWNRAPVVDVPWLVLPLTLGVAAFIAGVTAWRTWTAKSTTAGKDTGHVGSALAAWVMLSIFLNPAAADYHYTLAVVPAFLLLIRFAGQSTGRIALAAALIGIVLIGAPWPQRVFAMSDGLAGLVAYPRLYGGLILWATAVLAQSPDSPSIPRPLSPISGGKRRA